MSHGAIAVLLSLGRNPVSGRPRAAERDARAVAVAFETGREVVGLHAGVPEECLRSYLGMGLSRVVVLEMPPGGDPVAPLAGYLGQTGGFAAVLAGSRAEQGEGSGLVPYGVAAALGMPVLPGVTSLAFAGGATQAVQALAGGRRRVLESPLPVLAIVDLQGPPIRQVARGPAARGRLETVPPRSAGPAPSLSPPVLEARAARRRPKRIGPEHTVQGDARRFLAGATPAEAAREILGFLEGERIIAPHRPPPGTMPPEGQP